MPQHPLDLTATSHRLRRLAAQRLLDTSALEAALARTGLLPDRASWKAFLRVHLLLLGVVLLAAGVVCFIAANWGRIDPHVRMGMAALLLASAAGAAAWLGTGRLPGRGAVLLAALLVGPLLAVYGQTYQTGADAWELFLGWTLLALPFALVARFGGLWLFWLLLAQLTVHLAWEQSGGDWMGPAPSWISAGLLLAGLVAWEAGSLRKVSWMSGRTVPRVLVLFLLVNLTWPGSELLLWSGLQSGRWHQAPALGTAAAHFALLLALVALLVLVYRSRIQDLLALALVAASGLVLVNVLLVRLLFTEAHGELGAALLLGVLILGQVGLVALWLGWEQKRFRTEGA